MPVLQNNLAIYIHWPYCLSKCPYCDFNSHVRDIVAEQEWCDGILRELDYFRQLSGPRIITSIFFGGGTPSLMRAVSVEKTLNRIAENWTVADTVEITLEANPTSVEAGKFRDFAGAGINRLSLGVQALNDKDLKALGREHDVVEARHAIALSQKYFSRASYDLIYARMGQSLSEWEQELKQAIAMTVGHLSLYQLTIERGTVFYHAHEKGRLVLPEEDVAADMYQLTQDICMSHGLPAYEVSNHAKPGEQSRHNLTYWQYGDYLGVGPGAHGRLTIGGVRHAIRQVRSPEKWLAKIAGKGQGTDLNETLSPRMTGEEMIMMGLRLNQGLDLENFQKITGRKFEDFTDQSYLQRLFELGYMEKDGHQLRATRTGMPLLNSLLSRILS